MTKLKYAKEDGDKEVFSPSLQIRPDIISAGKPPTDDSLSSMGGDYSKANGVLSQSLFVVVSGGTERERSFFQELDDKESFKSLKVVFLSSKKGAGGLTPKMMKKYWSDCLQVGLVEKGNLRFRIESIDKVYMVTDVDHYEEELRDILQTHQNDEPQWIISNPDIEIWIYYCFRNSPLVDLQPVLSAPQSKRSSLMKTINGSFNNGGGLDPRKAFAELTTGIVNARSFYKEDCMHFPKLLSTQMFLLAKEILDVLGQEFESWNDARIKRINSYRSRL